MKNEYMNSKNRKEFVYKFADGETVVLTADERNMSADAHHVSMEWINVLRNEERKIYNNEQTETRRHCSMEAMNPDFPSNFSFRDEDGDDKDDMETAWASLSKCLTTLQAAIGKLYFVDGATREQIAAYFNVAPTCISHHLTVIKNKIEKNSLTLHLLAFPVTYK